MKLKFTKMHGAGNDFVVIDAVRQRVALTPGQVRYIADRQRGVGCDQVLLVCPPDDPDADFRYRIFNADGSKAGQCGNGARCFGCFVRDKRLTDRDQLRVQVGTAMMLLEIGSDGRVRADLGPPRFAPNDVPFAAAESQSEYTLEVGDESITLGALSVGNPHAILTVDDVEQAPVEQLGRAIECHPSFPERVNVGFMQLVSATEIRLRVFERGAGGTQACGSGACAAVIHGIRCGHLVDTVTVHLPGGKLSVSWKGEGHSVWLGGPVASVFDGSIKLHKR